MKSSYKLCSFKRGLLASSMLAAGLTVPAGAAEAEKDTSFTLEEILVTAQKRTESLQDVPISISALGAEELEAMRVMGVDDYITSIPNATYITAGAYWGQNVTLRGISDFSGGRYEVISVMVDDMGFGAINSNSILSAQFWDIDRIEVLRGPQGTLSGRNSMGGAINIITAKPSTENYEMKATLDYGRFDTFLGKLTVNVPVSDTVAVRATAYTEQADGAIKNIGPAGGSSSKDNYGGRAAVRWTPNDRLTLDASIAYEQQDRGSEPFILRSFFDEDFQEAQVTALESWGGVYLDDVDFYADVGNNGGKVKRDVYEYTKITDWIASFEAAYEFDNHTIQLLYGHFSYEIDYQEDYDQTEYSWWKTTRNREVKTDTAEFRISSDYEGAFNWVAGASYLKETQDNDQIDWIGIWATQGGTPRYAGEGGYTPAYRGLSNDNMKSIGFFANAFWDISSSLHLSAGARYSIETTQFGSKFNFDTANLNPDFVSPITDADLRPEAKIKKFSPRIALNYDLTENATVYAQFSTGYRAGYGNDAQSVSVGAPEKVLPEKLINYELGYKAQLLDNRVNVAAAVFLMDYTSLQVEELLDPALNPFPFNIYYDINAGKAQSKGFELEAEALVTRELVLDASIGYTKATIKEVTLDSVDYTDVGMPNVRPWTVSLSATYTKPIKDDIEGIIKLDYQYQDSLQWRGVLPDPRFYVDAYNTVDLSIGLQTDSWTVTAYFENVLNEKYHSAVGWETVGFRGPLLYTEPRMFGIRLTYKMGGQ
ncbi:TonB-dependent receptor [Kordiimonas pumila]|uniref:TonB-dependent receptor n=1 Tax=Kordiimonas pumila TaxID=2161677 RepID=A0ABV7D0X9_9PROT|nr:TonB-dependent receptor [Kordiimonas pumila]